MEVQMAPEVRTVVAGVPLEPPAQAPDPARRIAPPLVIGRPLQRGELARQPSAMSRAVGIESRREPHVSDRRASAQLGRAESNEDALGRHGEDPWGPAGPAVDHVHDPVAALPSPARQLEDVTSPQSGGVSRYLLAPPGLLGPPQLLAQARISGDVSALAPGPLDVGRVLRLEPLARLLQLHDVPIDLILRKRRVDEVLGL